MKAFLRQNKQEGFIALISAIIISAVLMFYVVANSFAGFYLRYDIMNAEAKERSVSLAEACVQTAILKKYQDSTYSGGGAPIPVGDGECSIISVTNSGSDYLIRVEAESDQAHTNLEVQIDGAGFNITDWKEVVSFP